MYYVTIGRGRIYSIISKVKTLFSSSNFAPSLDKRAEVWHEATSSSISWLLIPQHWLLQCNGDSSSLCQCHTIEDPLRISLAYALIPGGSPGDPQCDTGITEYIAEQIVVLALAFSRTTLLFQFSGWSPPHVLVGLTLYWRDQGHRRKVFFR